MLKKIRLILPIVQIIIGVLIIGIFLGDLFPKPVEGYFIIIQKHWYDNIPILFCYFLIILYTLSLLKKEISFLYILGISLGYIQFFFTLNQGSYILLGLNSCFLILWLFLYFKVKAGNVKE
jgi:hypothetical protein